MKLINVPLTLKELRGLIRDYRSWAKANREMVENTTQLEYKTMGRYWTAVNEGRANELEKLLPPKRKR